MNEIKEIPESIFSIILKGIQQYQESESSLMAKCNMVITMRVLFMELVIRILSLG